MQKNECQSVHSILTYFVALCEQVLGLSQSAKPFTSSGEVHRRQLSIKQTLQDEGPYAQGLEVGKLLTQSLSV